MELCGNVAGVTKTTSVVRLSREAMKKRSLDRINGIFEQVFSTVLASAAVFTQSLV